MHNLLLLHGAIGSSFQLNPIAEKLSDFNLHCPELPGHGGTATNKEFSIPYFADHIKRYCQEHGLETLSVFGYSMGGYIAMYIQKNFPGTFRQIITLATKFHWDQKTAEKEIKMLQPELIEQKLPQFAIELKKRHSQNDWKEVLNNTALMLKQMGAENPLKLEDYASIETPCLIMLGDRDRMVSTEETMAVYQKLPNAQMAILPGTPHTVEQNNAELIAFFIKRFIG